MKISELRPNILHLLGGAGRLKDFNIAERLDVPVSSVEKEILSLEQGCRAVFDGAELSENTVKALIKVKVKPEREGEDCQALEPFPAGREFMAALRTIRLATGSQGKKAERCGAFCRQPPGRQRRRALHPFSGEKMQEIRQTAAGGGCWP